jgi:hypothetical protein
MNPVDPKEFPRVTWAQLFVLLAVTLIGGFTASSLLRRLDDSRAPLPLMSVQTQNTEMIEMLKYRDNAIDERLKELKATNVRIERRLADHLDKPRKCTIDGQGEE